MDKQREEKKFEVKCEAKVQVPNKILEKIPP